MRRALAMAIVGAVQLGWVGDTAHAVPGPTAGTAEARATDIVRSDDDTAISSKQLEIALTALPAVVPPGGSFTLVYRIDNWEETDERVRLRVVAGPGWTVGEAALEQREWPIEAFGQLGGELRLTLPDDAPVGARQLVRLVVHLAGESGRIEARTFVSVSRRGTLRRAGPTVSGSWTLGVTGVGVQGVREAATGGAVALSARLASNTHVAFAYDRGLEQSLSNFRYSEPFTRAAGTLRHGPWLASFGNHVWSPGDALAGPFVQGTGATLKGGRGRLAIEAALIQPEAFGASAGGHLVRGRVGVTTPRIDVALSASDFGRPAGGYTALASVQETPLDPDAEEEVELERRLTAEAPSNRVRGLGLEAELRPTPAHRLTVRAGVLSMANTAGMRVGAPVGEASYSFARPGRGSVTGRWRRMPPTLPGLYMPGGEMSLYGSARLAGPVEVLGRAFSYETATVDRDIQSRSDGGSLGLRFGRGAHRLEVRANYRESGVAIRTIRRSLTLLAGAPVGPVAASAHVDIGEQDNGSRRQRVAFYRGDLRWEGEAGTMSVSLSHSEGIGTRRLRLDLLTSLELSGWSLAGGLWATHGYVAGGRPGLWASIGVPVGRDVVVTLGVDRAPITWTADPTWRGMLAVRKGFELSLPFWPSGPPAGREARQDALDSLVP